MLPAITYEQGANASGVDPELSELRKYISRSASHLPKELAHYRSFTNELSVTNEAVVLICSRVCGSMGPTAWSNDKPDSATSSKPKAIDNPSSP